MQHCTIALPQGNETGGKHNYQSIHLNKHMQLERVFRVILPSTIKPFNPLKITQNESSETSFYFKQVAFLLFFQNSNGQPNSPSVEFWWEKTQVNLRRASTEPSMDFRRANMEPSIHFGRANMEIYQKQNVNLSKRVGKDGVSSGPETPSFPPLLLRLTQYILIFGCTKVPFNIR